MALSQIMVVAVVQGVTESLPIGSTAYLYLISWLPGWQTEALDFDIAPPVATLLAILLDFLRGWLQILAKGLGVRFGRDQALTHNHMMPWLLASPLPPFLPRRDQ